MVMELVTPRLLHPIFVRPPCGRADFSLIVSSLKRDVEVQSAFEKNDYADWCVTSPVCQLNRLETNHAAGTFW